MTSSITRSSRSSVKKVSTNTMDSAISKPKTTSNNKKKKQIQRSKKDVDLENRSQQQQEHQQQQLQQPQQQQQEQIDKNNELFNKIDASEHPEYVRLMDQLDQSKNERLKKVENWRNLERQSIHDWFAAQKKQAWDDFYFARKKVRSDLVEEVQSKIAKLKQELTLLNKQTKVQQATESECDYEDWVPPERLYAIGSFVGGATNDEADRDLVYARQPYNGNNTPNLVYSDYESRSTTDTAEDGDVVSPTTRTEMASTSSTTSHHHNNNRMNDHYPYQQQPANNNNNNNSNNTAFGQPAQRQQEYSNNNTNNNSNPIYPPFEFDDVPQDGRNDWWHYRSTTTA